MPAQDPPRPAVTAVSRPQGGCALAIEALSELEPNLHAFLERIPAGFAMFDEQMRYMAVSRRFLFELGQDAATHEVIGRRHYDLFPEIPDRWREIHSRVLAGETLSAVEDPFPRPDGRIDWVNWEMMPWRRADGSVGGALLFSEIVTAQKAAREAQAALTRSEAALRENETRLRLALRIGGIASVDRDLTTGRAVWSEEYARLYGLAETACDTFECWLDRIHPEDRDRAAAEAHACLDTRHPIASEYRIIRAGDGAVRWISHRCEVFHDAAGRPVRAIACEQDVTDLRIAEEVLARDKAELEQLVEARTRDLQETQTQLAHAQRMTALGALAGGVAHDFNNLLQAIQGSLALIARKPAEAERVLRYAGIANEAARRGAVITRRLLAFARRGDLHAEPIDPVRLLEDLREMLEPTLGASVQVRLQTEAGLPPLLADKGELEAVLVNLAANARDAMPGGGTLTLAVSLDQIGAERPNRDLAPGRYVRLRVCDTGEGMPPEVLARVTEPFFTTKPQGKGTGLGLAMAKGFAEQSGGALAIHSAPGRGAIVTLWFPTAAAPPTAPSPPSPALDEAPHARSLRRILLVDDDAEVRGVLADQLEAAGYAVLSEPSGPEALAALDRGEPVELILSDLAMPDMDGIETITEAQRRRPGLPALLLTGFATDTPEFASRAREGVFSLMHKPVDFNALAERIEALLKAREQNRGGGREG